MRYLIFLISFVSPVFSQTAPLTCDGTAYLLSARYSKTPSVINLANGDTGVETGVTIMPSKGEVYNGLAYNPNNDLLYALVGVTLDSIETASLVTIDADGVVTDLGKPTPAVGGMNLPDWILAVSGNFGVEVNVGAIDSNIYYTIAIDDTKSPVESYLLKVNLADMTYTEVKLSQPIRMADFTFSKETRLIYALTKIGVVSIDPNTGALTVLSTAELTNAGGAWTDSNGDVYLYSNIYMGNNKEAKLFKYDVSGDVFASTVNVTPYNYFDATACYSPNFTKQLVSTTSPQLTPFDAENELAEPGETLTYQITLANPDSSAKNNIAIKDSLLLNLPAGISLTRAPTASASTLTENAVGDYVLDVIPAGATIYVTYDVTTSNNPAEFSSIGGAVVNAITTDGTTPPTTCDSSNADLCTSTPVQRNIGSIGGLKRVPSLEVLGMLGLLLSIFTGLAYQRRKNNR